MKSAVLRIFPSLSTILNKKSGFLWRSNLVAGEPPEGIVLLKCEMETDKTKEIAQIVSHIIRNVFPDKPLLAGMEDPKNTPCMAWIGESIRTARWDHARVCNPRTQDDLWIFVPNPYTDVFKVLVDCWHPLLGATFIAVGIEEPQKLAAIYSENVSKKVETALNQMLLTSVLRSCVCVIGADHYSDLFLVIKGRNLSGILLRTLPVALHAVGYRIANPEASS